MAWPVKSVAAVALLIWFSVLLYVSSSLYSVQGNQRDSFDPRLIDKLDTAISSIEKLQKQNEQLKQLIEDERREHAEVARVAERSRKLVEGRAKESHLEDKAVEKIDKEEKMEQKKGSLFSRDHEVLRRGLDQRIWEMFYYLHSQFNKADVPFKNHTENQLYSLLAYSSKFGDVDEGKKWRVGELKALTDRIQSKIDETQNPMDCKTAKSLICVLDKECGFGCQLHHVAYCFVTAFGEGRAMIMQGDGKRWRYSKKGWTAVFQPVSKCGYDEVLNSEPTTFFSPGSTARVVTLGIIDGLTNRPAHLPLSFPKGLESEMLKLHSNPPVFFISQFIWYLMRSAPDLGSHLDNARKNVPFGKSPIVGLQIRRTDKIGTEAAFHSVEEYMEWTEIWFQVQDRKSGKKLPRRVFIASDDPSVIPEARKKYPVYEVFGDEQTATGAQLQTRYTDSSLYGVVTDITLLSHCDYLVCTFSSQVCRMGYELMQVRRGDAGERFHSLDDIYYYGGQHAHEQTAIEAHKPESPGEIELQVGDDVGIAGNHWDGYSKGTNRRTGETGVYPSYKVVEKWRIVDFSLLQ